MRSLLCKGTDVHQITLSDREQNGCVTDTTHLLDGVLQSGFHCLCEGCSVQGVNVEAPVVGAILIVGVVGLLLFLCLCLCLRSILDLLFVVTITLVAELALPPCKCTVKTAARARCPVSSSN